jgi:hypothetical protein
VLGQIHAIQFKLASRRYWVLPFIPIWGRRPTLLNQVGGPPVLANTTPALILYHVKKEATSCQSQPHPCLIFFFFSFSQVHVAFATAASRLTRWENYLCYIHFRSDRWYRSYVKEKTLALHDAWQARALIGNPLASQNWKITWGNPMEWSWLLLTWPLARKCWVKFMLFNSNWLPEDIGFCRSSRSGVDGLHC